MTVERSKRRFLIPIVFITKSQTEPCFLFCFLDTKHERNALMTRVYPQLKEFCKSKGYEFQVVDMRWGVRDESTADHMTTALCMQEIKACQELSTGPNFVVC